MRLNTMHDVFVVELRVWQMYHLGGDSDGLIVLWNKGVRFPDGAGDGHGYFHCVCVSDCCFVLARGPG